MYEFKQNFDFRIFIISIILLRNLTYSSTGKTVQLILNLMTLM